MARSTPHRPGWPGLSVRARATIGTTLAFAVALGTGSVFLIDRQRSALTDSVQTTAQLRADDLAAVLEDGDLPERVAVPEEDTAFVQIVDLAGHVLRASPNIEGEAALLTFAPPSEGFAARTFDVGKVSDDPFRVVVRQAHTPSGSLQVFVGSSLAAADASVHSLATGLGLGVPLLLVIAGALTWLAVGRSLRPVDAIRAEVEQISQRQLHRRVPEPSVRDEIGRLAITMNQMLERLDDATRQQRRFVADASHELRSPLAGIRAHLEVDLAHPGRADWQHTEREVLEEALRLQRLVDDLLVLARADAPAGATRRELIDLDDVVLKEVRRLRGRAKVSVDATGVQPVQVVGDADALTRVLHNLLDNAERHASSTVTVTLQPQQSTASVAVSDDGSGIEADLEEHIFERFSRGDHARDRGHGGTGLGLAIAREIVTAHGGTLTLNGAGGLTTFVVKLPAPA